MPDLQPILARLYASSSQIRRGFRLASFGLAQYDFLSSPAARNEREHPARRVSVLLREKALRAGARGRRKPRTLAEKGQDRTTGSPRRLRNAPLSAGILQHSPNHLGGGDALGDRAE